MVCSAHLIDEYTIEIEHGGIVKVRKGLKDLPIDNYINSDNTIKKFPEGWEDLPAMKTRANAAIKVIIENTKCISSSGRFVPYCEYCKYRKDV